MKLLKTIDLNDLVFIDIETVRLTDSLEKDSDLYKSWEYKLRYTKENEDIENKPLEISYKQKVI